MAHEGHDHGDHPHDHPHDHDEGRPVRGPVHAHAHIVSHEGRHQDPPARAMPGPSPSAFGKGNVLYLDAASGLAGDMIVAALLNLGAPRSVLDEALSALPLSGYRVRVHTREVSGIVATKFDVDVAEGQPFRTYKDIVAMLEGHSGPAFVRARSIFRYLAEAEAKVHRMSVENVHFHEVGAVDSIVDIVAASALLEHVGATCLVSPLPMGRGTVRAEHGVIPLPSPATLECLRGFHTVEGGHPFEFVTPTGAAIVGCMAESVGVWPSMKPLAVGYGAGTKSLPDRPNVLRVVLGEASKGAAHPTHVVVEANIDDATGETLAYAITSLLKEGALDAWCTPIVMKKGRPATTVSAIAPKGAEARVASCMLRVTPTLGVRVHEVSRVALSRRTESVETEYGVIPVKIASGEGVLRMKPEFDACAAAAEKHGVSLERVVEAARGKARGCLREA